MKTYIEILYLLLELTEAGKIVWTKTDYYQYEAQSGEDAFMIEFYHPLRADENGSDADIAEISAGGIRMTFYIGTQGFDIVLEILAVGFPSWNEHRGNMQQRAEKAVRMLKAKIQE